MACNNNNKTVLLEKQIDSLKQQLNNSYKPGLGEFMSSLQMHHAKLWFAGINSNWLLADFEVNEIRETVDNIEKYCLDRKEAKMVKPLLMPAIDSVAKSFLYQNEQNVENFKKTFSLLTISCNNCHKENLFGFNKITIPSSSPVSNQDFKYPQFHKDTIIKDTIITVVDY
jgi:hypothetical protein